MPLAGLKALSAKLVGAKWIGTETKRIRISDSMANQMSTQTPSYDPT